MSASPKENHPEMTASGFDGRMVSLDAFRGLTIGGMILVNNPGSWNEENLYSQLQHAKWDGCTLTDLVFPFFLFILGVAIPISFDKRLHRGASRRRVFAHVMWRSLILFALGLLLAAFPNFGNWESLRILGVLQRIALVYLFASLVYLFMRPAAQAATAAVLLLGYWLAMTLVNVPGHGTGVLTIEGNLATYIDNIVLGPSHMYKKAPPWEPEGFLSTLPAVVTAILGMLTGKWLSLGYQDSYKITVLCLFGAVGMLVGYLWGFWFPINKGLWTSSYVLYTAGAASLLLGAFYWIIDVYKIRALFTPLVVFGSNAIVAYVGSSFVAKCMNIVTVAGPDSVQIPLKSFVYQNFFVPWAGSLNGSLAYAISYVLLWLLLIGLLYRNRIFIKV